MANRYNIRISGFGGRGIVLSGYILGKAAAIFDNKRIIGIPATEFAMEMGNKIIANILMLGFFTGISKIISVEAMKESIKTTVKKAFIDLNLEAFDRRYEYVAKFTSREALASHT